jgi:hypothetical protein
MMSGPQLRSFRSGWAIAGFGAVHFFMRDESNLRYAITLCGLRGYLVRALHEPGSWTRWCRRCERSLAKGTRK